LNILFLVGSSGGEVETAELSPKSIVSTATVYNYFIRTELARMDGVTTATQRFPIFKSASDVERYYDENPIIPADHVVCLEQRGFQKNHPEVFKRFREKIPGVVAAICDHDQLIGPEDILFHVQQTRHYPVNTKSVQVTWAASPLFCYPEKELGTLNILVDHNHYHGEDRTTEILDQISEFALGDFLNIGSRYGYSKIKIRQFVSGGIADIEPGRNMNLGGYNRKGMPFTDACSEYRKADIFFVTHAESMGLSVIECAMSGALIVTPHGCINPFLIEPLNHLVWDDRFDMEEVLAAIDPGYSASCAAPFNWQRLATTILNHCRLFGREPFNL